MRVCWWWLAIVSSLYIIQDVDDSGLTKRFIGKWMKSFCRGPFRLAAATIRMVVVDGPRLLAPVIPVPVMIAKREEEEEEEKEEEIYFNATHLLKFASLEEMVNSPLFTTIKYLTTQWLVQLDDGLTVTGDYKSMQGEESNTYDVIVVDQVEPETIIYPILNCWVGGPTSGMARLKYDTQLDSAGGLSGSMAFASGSFPAICDSLFTLHLEHALGTKLTSLLEISGSQTCQLAPNTTLFTRLFAEKVRYQIRYRQRRLYYSRHLDHWRLGRWNDYNLVVFGDGDTAITHCINSNSDDICNPGPATVIDGTPIFSR